MAEQRRAFITGVTGQDGSYMAQQLLDKGYEVHGFAGLLPSIVGESITFTTMSTFRGGICTCTTEM